MSFRIIPKCNEQSKFKLNWLNELHEEMSGNVAFYSMHFPPLPNFSPIRSDTPTHNAMVIYKGNASNKMLSFLRPSIFLALFSICPLYQSIVLLLLHLSPQTEVVSRGDIMEKIVYFKLLQIVLTLAFIWQLLSLHQFCGTFADPKAFLHDISVGHCKSFTLIGKNSKSGEFGAVFDHHKWYNQLSMSSTDGPPIEEQQHQFMDELAAKLPSAGRHCIPITITPFDSIGKDRNPLKNYTLFFFSGQLIVALCTLVVCFCGFMDLLLSVEEYEVCFQAFYPAFCWSLSAVTSSKLLLDWTGFWSCVNFQADHTNVPLVTLVICIVMVCLSVFEFFFMNSLLKKRPMCASTAAEVQHQKLRNDVATECANVIIHQQKQKNGSAVM